MQPEFLCRWLEPGREYLAGRGFALPPAGSDGPVDYDRLAGIFMEPDGDMPRELMQSASLIHEMSSENAMYDLLDGIQHAGLALEVGDDPDPVDVAVQVWLRAPKVLEDAHQMHELDRPRGFTHFVTDRRPDPGFDGPTARETQDLERELADWFFRILGTCPAAVAGSADITDLYTARYGAPKAGTKVYVQVNQVVDGWESLPRTYSAIVPAGA